MQDEINATLALCDTSSEDGGGCPHYGCCHIECLPAARRPPLQAVLDAEAAAAKEAREREEAAEAAAAAAAAGADDVEMAEAGDAPAPAEEGATNGDAAATAAEAPRKLAKAPVAARGGAHTGVGPFGRPLAADKKKWAVSRLKWHCVMCEQNQRADGGCPPAPSDAAAGPAAASGGGGAPPRPELTAVGRRLLRQYYELCKRPDEGQLAVLARVTDREASDVANWFAACERAESDKERARQRAEQAKAAGGAAGPSAAPRPPQQQLSPQQEKAIDALRARGNAAYQAGNLAEARKLYSQAISLDPSGASAHAHKLHSNLSAVYASLKDWKNSLLHAKRCVDVDHNFSKGWSRIGTAHANMSQPALALQAFRTCLRLDPGNAHAAQAVTSLERQLPPGSAGPPAVPPPAPSVAAVAAARPAAARPAGPPPGAAGPPPGAAGGAAQKRPHEAAAAARPDAKRPAVGGAPTAGAATSAEANQAAVQAGNACYKRDDYAGAVAAFTLAIGAYATAEVPAQLLSNRSAAYAGLKEYSAATQDAAAWTPRRQRATHVRGVWNRR